MGKFFNGKIKRDRTSLVKYTVIGIGVLVIIILLFAIGCRKREDFTDQVKIKKNGITIEINEEFPEVIEYIEEIAEYPYTDSLKYEFEGDNCDSTQVMTCKVTISGNAIDDIKTKLHIKDTTAPDLIVKDTLQIDVNEKYIVEDFVDYCEDNSGEECIVRFYDPSEETSNTEDEVIDENTPSVDYGSYTGNGTYKVYIVAEDVNGNITEPMESTLIIGSGDNNDTTCSFGNMKVSETRVKFPIAVYVGDEALDCAIDKALWDNALTQVPANDLYKMDYQRLQNELQDVLRANYPNGANIKVYPNYISVLNDSLTGLVGYGIFVKVYVGELNKQVDLDENLIMSYYLYPNGDRLYIANKYQLHE